jgi:hypothetical protein
MIWIAVAVPVIFSIGFVVGTTWASLVIAARADEEKRDRDFRYKLG